MSLPTGTITSPTDSVSPVAIAGSTWRSRFGIPTWGQYLLASPLAVIGFVLFAIIALAGICAPLLTPYHPIDMIGPLGSPPTHAHPFGTNDVGQDVFAQALYGARFSLSVGIGSGICITFFATVLGMVAGYVGRWVDDTLSVLMNIFLVVPQLPLLVVIAAYIPFKGNDPAGSAMTMIVVITITGWAWGARVMRSQTLTLRNRDFVQAAIVAGQSQRTIIFDEIMPNMVSLLANTIIMSSMGGILTEAALDYLGVGSVSQVTWGTMLNRAQAGSTLFSGEWWCFVFPGLAIAVTAMSMILMNYGVDLISNPRLRLSRPKRSARSRRAAVVPLEAAR
jgi:peptide/nickel transport system permease protein